MGGGDAVELSIEETNALRIKLGLKPLDLSAAPPKPEQEAQENYQRLREQQTRQAEEDELRERIERVRNKRKRNAKLDGKGLAEDEPDDAASWVRSSRDRALASKLEQRFEELEGAATTATTSEATLAKEYAGDDLRGLRVVHNVGDFGLGEERILTLKDSTILENEEEGDELESIELSAHDRLNKNLENKKKKPKYRGYDDDEFTEEGAAQKSVLSHYDEEISGPTKKSFTISEGGMVSEEKRREGVSAKLRGGALSLDMDKMQEIRDYYTNEEMNQFRKGKKKRVVKTRKPLSEALSSGLAEDDTSMETTGTVAQPQPSFEPTPISEDANFVDDEDLAEALARTRRLAAKQVRMTPEQVAAAAREARLRDQEREAEEQTDNSRVISSVTEFVRNLSDVRTSVTVDVSAGAMPADYTEEPEDDRHKARPAADTMPRTVFAPANEGADEDEDDEDDRGERMDFTHGDAASSATGGSAGHNKEDSDDETAMTKERTVGKGIGAALALFKAKGYVASTDRQTLERDERLRDHHKFMAEEKRARIEREQKNKAEQSKPSKKKNADPQAEREKEREKERERERELRESLKRFENYKPDVKLNYVDEYGRHLNTKEAFRQFSHVFHGKHPGRRKVEKELKKLEEELLMAKAPSTDTPLGTVSAMMQKQQQTGSAYLVLSTGNKTGITGSIRTDSKSGTATSLLGTTTVSKKP